MIVVGAGPAGAVTALLLARAGRDVLLLDRATFPRPKPCGDCLSVGATTRLGRLGVLPAVRDAAHSRLAGWRIIAPDGSSFESDFTAPNAADPSERDDRTALSIERRVLDDILVRAAVQAGARLQRDSIVDIRRDAAGGVVGLRGRAHDYSAAVTVGADGLRSVVANRLGARMPPGPLRKVSLTYHVPVDGVGDLGEMHVGDGLCAGVAPVDDQGRCNLTFVADSARFGRTVALGPASFARAALEMLPSLRGRVGTRALDDAAPLASGPFDRPVRRIAFSGAVLVGDAAGYYDPFTGQGVHHALASAELLAPCIDAALRAADTRASAFADWSRAHAALARGPRRVQRIIEAVIARPALAGHAIRRIRRAPAFARTLLAVTGDIAPPRALLSPGAAAHLLFPALLPENAA